MIVGFMRNFINPTYMARLTAMLCQYHGMDLVYLRPRDVDMNNHTVKGKLLVDDTWITAEMELPPFIDISPFCINEKNKQLVTYLRQKTFLSDDGRNVLDKAELQTELQKDQNFAHLVIPTHSVQDNFDSVEKYVNKYSAIVLKPIGGQQGNGVYLMKKEKDTYIIGQNVTEKKCTYKEIQSFFDESVKNREYIIQKYISSRTLQGDPFDCRIHVEKNENGKWQIAKNYIRIGIDQKVISNVNQGGGISDLKPFLDANFEEKAEEILGNIKRLSKTLPYKIEELRGTHMMSMGLDIGIDNEGQLHLFEANRAPETASIKAKVAMLRTDYYKYVEDNIINRNFPLDYDTMANERTFYKKKFKDMKRSTSWRITKPLRVLSEIVKKK